MMNDEESLPNHHPTNVSYTPTNVEFESSICLIFLSAILFFILSALLANFARGNTTRNSPWYIFILFLGILVSLLTTSSIDTGDEKFVYFTYIATVNVVVGILITVVGSHVFFEAVSNDEEPIGLHHPKMSMIIWFVTIPLSLLGILKAVTSWKSNKERAVTCLIGLFQKLVQAGVYHFELRHKRPRRDHDDGASLYLKIISYFNYVMWLDSMLMGHDKGDGSLEKKFGKGFSIVAFASSALLIDYHLLCCLIFAEHSIEVDKPPRHIEFDDDIEIDDGPANNTQIKIHVSRMRGIGALVGLVCICLQLLATLQYLHLFSPWVNIFPIMVDILVMVLAILLMKETGCYDRKSKDDGRSTDSKGVDIMIAVMGIIGFLFWFHKTTIVASFVKAGMDTSHDAYLNWTLAKNIFRTVGILFQMYFFMNINPLAVTQKEYRRNKFIHFIIPALTLALLSVFISTIVDTYSGMLEEHIEKSELSNMKKHLLQAGEPIHLGFCLHLFLYLFIMSNHLREKQKGYNNQSNGNVIINNNNNNNNNFSMNNPARTRLRERKVTLVWN